MRLYLMFASQPGPDTERPVLSETWARLRQRGFEVEVGYSAEILTPLTRVEPVYDLYLLKSRSPFWLNLAGILHYNQARILNPYESCLIVLNKVLLTERLQAHHIPTPRSWVTGEPSLLDTLVAQRPLILKPYNGFGGAGVQVVRRPADLRALALPSDLILVQEYVEGGEAYLKVYVIGEQVFGMRQRFRPHQNPKEMGIPGEVNEEIRSIVLQCGQILQLTLYNVDIVFAPDGPKVIDINYFPSYQGVPEAALYLADYIEAYARCAR
jgi:ribosomal protein S6--L-glutamate ligase